MNGWESGRYTLELCHHTNQLPAARFQWQGPSFSFTEFVTKALCVF